MFKRFLLVAPLALALTACGSSGDTGTQQLTTPASPTTAARNAPATAPASTTGTATAAPAAAASSSSAAAMASSAPASAQPAEMSDAAKAAMVKAAKNFSDNGKWVKGKNYFVIQPQQPKVTNTHKIEVVEVFNWGCPACNAAHKFIDKMETALPAYATMAYLPAGFRPDENWTLYQRTWYAAKALGLAQKSYDAMFNANWKTGETGSYNLATGRLNPRSKWPDIHTIATFYHDKYGVPVKQFVAVANSFAINTKMKRADELVKDYGVRGTPTIIVDGRYRFDFSSAGSYGKGIELAKWLVAKEAKRRVSQQQTASK